MGRKKFLSDLEAIRNRPSAHVTNIERHDDDIVSFSYWFSHGSTTKEIRLRLFASNTDEYPDHNQYMLFTDETNLETWITDSFEQIQAVIDGSSLSTALREVSGALHQTLTSGLEQNPVIISSSSQSSHGSEKDQFEDEEEEEEDDDDDDDAGFGIHNVIVNKHVFQSPWETEKRNLKGRHGVSMASDLLRAKTEGFKVGMYGNPSGTAIVSISIKIAKLGISEETMAAWDLTRDQYLVLLVRYQQGYMSMADVLKENTLNGSVEMRAGLCTTYKPNRSGAFAAFDQTGTTAGIKTKSQALAQDATTTKGNLLPLFIGRPLNDLLRTRLVKIVKFRDLFMLRWAGAERMFNDTQSAHCNDLKASEGLEKYRMMDDYNNTRALPKIVTDDTLEDCFNKSAVFPLVAMQFVLRHFVRCTEFCLVCHCHIGNTFEALKPYVCSSPLCLYQFLSLGFGPAAEWEILSQPYVVDLLISLCYFQSRALKIRELPVGINLKVPILPIFKNQATLIQVRHLQHTVVKDQGEPPEPLPFSKGQLNIQQKSLMLTSSTTNHEAPSISKGDWVVLVPTITTEGVGAYHCCVTEVNGRSLGIRLTHSRCFIGLHHTTGSDSLKESASVEVDCYSYDENFDDLPNHYQQHAITLLLDTLPSVNDMRIHLLSQQSESHDSSLNLLRSQCPRSAVDLLRWIIASNRSCIMQVDKVKTVDNNLQIANPSEDRVSGMDEWMQFRFAQGAPDKEQRFVDCVSTRSTNPQYPTLFAWHGSPLYNWHSIIRQGLNFDEVLHGRANGHGVYMSSQLNTSMSYVGNNFAVATGLNMDWPHSALKISCIVSLQEVVNAPETFVSRSPHFVVAKKDWIQTRYLFIKTTAQHSAGSASTVIYEQDPRYTAIGVTNQPVLIPITAISSSRRAALSTAMEPKSKKRKISSRDGNNLNASHTEEEDSASDVTDQEDRDFLDLPNDDHESFDDEDVVMTDMDDLDDDIGSSILGTSSTSKEKQGSGKSYGPVRLDNSKTDFIPGALDTSGIHFLSVPEQASSSATKALMRAFNETLKVQEMTPLHELGFYLDSDRVENMYQWIVEMHSFDKSLPLAQDMKAAGITAIVIEMQFTNDYPFSPPFVRVVKPRFVEPLAGGGGHITSGGAICMELLTTSGWSAANSMESVLLQVRLAMTERERPARLLKGRTGFQNLSYSIGEAIVAYKRFCTAHGWRIPAGVDSLQAN